MFGTSGYEDVKFCPHCGSEHIEHEDTGYDGDGNSYHRFHCHGCDKWFILEK